MAWEHVVVWPLEEILTRLGAFLPRLVGILIILVIGWVIAKSVQAALIKVLRVMKLDVASEKSGIAAFLAKGDIKYTLSEAIGLLVYWFMMMMVLIAIVNVLGLTVAADLLTDLIGYLPHVIAAIFILVLGTFLAVTVEAFVRAGSASSGFKKSILLGQIVKVLIVIFTIAVALEQLKIGIVTITWVVKVVLGSLGLAVGLAFGLGCKDLAGQLMKELIAKLKK